MSIPEVGSFAGEWIGFPDAQNPAVVDTHMHQEGIFSTAYVWPLVSTLHYTLGQLHWATPSTSCLENYLLLIRLTCLLVGLPAGR